MLGCYMAWFTHVHEIVALALFLTVEIQGKNIHVATESRHSTWENVILNKLDARCDLAHHLTYKGIYVSRD